MESFIQIQPFNIQIQLSGVIALIFQFVSENLKYLCS